MKEIAYVIKDYTDENFTNLHRTEATGLVEIAKEIAEAHYSWDPCHPDDFYPTIGIKTSKGEEFWFEITAEIEIKFNVQTLKK